ncbi:MAG TPA: hypothetical protein VES64_00235 [Allosphingosinicella sp.]|nr:hypothetical protein [Allosphingosinicella sp.]
MKYFMTAVALVIAAPAAAQTAPAQQHQGHDQHQQHGQGQHQGQAQHGQHQHGQHQQGQHQEQGDCCADRNGNGRMDCCEGMAQSGDRRGCCPEPAPTPAPAAPPQAN